MKEKESKPQRDYEKEAEALKKKVKDKLAEFEKFCKDITKETDKKAA